MFSIKGYDRWKTASPYDRDYGVCGNCGKSEEDHLAADEMPDYNESVRERAEAYLERLRKVSGNDLPEATRAEIIEELQRILSWCTLDGVVCAGYVEAEEGEPDDADD